LRVVQDAKGFVWVKGETSIDKYDQTVTVIGMYDKPR
jgi:hypothetical protein